MKKAPPKHPTSLYTPPRVRDGLLPKIDEVLVEQLKDMPDERLALYALAHMTYDSRELINELVTRLLDGTNKTGESD